MNKHCCFSNLERDPQICTAWISHRPFEQRRALDYIVSGASGTPPKATTPRLQSRSICSTGGAAAGIVTAFNLGATATRLSVSWSYEIRFSPSAVSFDRPAASIWGFLAMSASTAWVMSGAMGSATTAMMRLLSGMLSTCVLDSSGTCMPRSDSGAGVV